MIVEVEKLACLHIFITLRTDYVQFLSDEQYVQLSGV